MKNKTSISFIIMINILILSMTACSKNIKEDAHTPKDNTAEESPKAEEPTEETIECYDMKDYADNLPDDMGGNLAETLAHLLFPNNPEVIRDEEYWGYSIGDGAISIAGSANSDGYFVNINKKLANFSVWGVRIGMTEEDATMIYETQGFIQSDTEYGTCYTIDEHLRIELSIEEGIVTHICYINFLGQLSERL